MRKMLRKFRLLTSGLSVGCNLLTAGVLPAAAEPRVAAQSDGITIFEDAVDRADGGTGTLLMARLDPRRMTTASQSILMLDGGNSATLRIQIGELTLGNGPFSRRCRTRSASPAADMDAAWT